MGMLVQMCDNCQVHGLGDAVVVAVEGLRASHCPFRRQLNDHPVCTRIGNS